MQNGWKATLMDFYIPKKYQEPYVEVNRVYSNVYKSQVGNYTFAWSHIKSDFELVGAWRGTKGLNQRYQKDSEYNLTDFVIPYFKLSSLPKCILRMGKY